MRGGSILLQDIKAPTNSTWESGLHAMKEALDLEKKVNQSLLELHKLAELGGDAQFADFIESKLCIFN